MTELSTLTRKLTLDLTAIPSVNGSSGETAIIEFLYHRLKRLPAVQKGKVKLFLIPSMDDPLFRPTLIAHYSGTGKQGLLLFGHTDTVGTSDYGPFESLAHRPLELTELAKSGALGEAAAKRASSGRFLFGRGILDMKSGVAAACTVFEKMVEASIDMHLFFAATPDEEVGSRGAKTLSRWLEDYTTNHNIHLQWVLNTDYTEQPKVGDPYPIYAGSIGKLLPAVYVRGLPSHAAEPEHGIDPNYLLSRITQKLVYCSDLVDATENERCPLPVSLYQRDDKPFYDVQTAISASAYYNLFHMTRSPSEQLKRISDLIEEEMNSTILHLHSLKASQVLPEKIPVYTYEDIWNHASEEVRSDALRYSESLTLSVELRERCRLMVDFLIQRGNFKGPLIVVYFANGLIPRVNTPSLMQNRFWPIVEQFSRETKIPYFCRTYFPYISDLSFLSQSPDWEDETFAKNFPAQSYASPGTTLQTATFMIGTSGVGAHRPDESVDAVYTFETLPKLLAHIVQSLETH